MANKFLAQSCMVISSILVPKIYIENFGMIVNFISTNVHHTD